MLYINQISANKIHIEKVENDKMVFSFNAFATFKANTGEGYVEIKDLTDKNYYLSVRLDELIINGEPSPTDLIEAIEALSFIGNFKSGGGSSSTTWGAITGDIDAQTDLKDKLDEIRDLATGARIGIVFDDEEQMNNWFAGTYIRPDGIVPGDLNVGESIYLRSIDEPDYWWDGTQALEQETKTDLSGYYTKTKIDDFVVHKAGAETLTGLKTLTAGVVSTAPVLGGGESFMGVTALGSYLGVRNGTPQSQLILGVSNAVLSSIDDNDSNAIGISPTDAILTKMGNSPNSIVKKSYVDSNFIKLVSNSAFYLDSVNGDDANDALTAATAKKTFSALSTYLKQIQHGAGLITIKFADGSYSLGNLTTYAVGMSAIALDGNSADSSKVVLTMTGMRGFEYCMVNNVTVVPATSQCSLYGVSYTYFNNVIMKASVWVYNSRLWLQNKYTFSGMSSTVFGKIVLDAGGALVMSGTVIQYIIEEAYAMRQLFTVQSGGSIVQELSPDRVKILKADGTFGDNTLYTGRTLNLYAGVVNSIYYSLDTLFPNGTVNAVPNTSDSSELSEGFVAPIKQPHNILTQRDVLDCHPISAITGLREALPKTGKRINTNIGVVGEGISASIKISDITDSYPELAGMDLVRVNVQRASTTVFNVYLATDFTSDINVSFCYINRYVTTYVSGNGYFLISPQSSVTALSITHGSIGNRLQYSTVIKFSDNITGKNYYIRFDGEISMTTEGLVNGTPPTLGTSTWKWEIFEV